MGHRSLMAMIIAIAMLFAPLAMQGGMAMAASGAHHGQVMKSGHCSGQPVKKSHSTDSSCCAAMCTAVAAAAAQAIEPEPLASSQQLPPADHFLRGFLAKLPTPPPRRS